MNGHVLDQDAAQQTLTSNGRLQVKKSHEHPGERIIDEYGTEWWVVDGRRGRECSSCHGWGCDRCKNEGVDFSFSHEDYQRYLAFEQRALDLMEQLLTHLDLPAPPFRKDEWREVRTDAARTLIRQWGKKGIVTPQMLLDIGVEWLEVLGTDDDNMTSPSRDNLHPKAAANAGEVGALVNQLTKPPLPAFFVTCQMCDGEGCGWCYGRGLAHPKSTEHDFDQIVGATDNLSTLYRTLEDPDFPHRHARALEWQYVMGRAADDLLGRWRQEDSADHEEYWPFDPDRPYRVEYPASAEEPPF